MSDRSFVEVNAASRARLEALLRGLSESELTRPLADGWTVAASLAHVAFYDRRAAVVLARAATGPVNAVIPDVHILNDALLPQWLLLSPGAVVDETIAAMRAADSAFETASEDVLALVREGVFEVDLLRSHHRDEHYEEIVAALR